MRKRKLVTAIATAALLLGTSYTVMADGSASSSYSSHTSSSNSSSGSTGSFGGSGSQSAASTGTGGAASGTGTVGGATGGAVSGGGLNASASAGASAGGGYAYAVGGEKHPKPPKPGKTVIGGGGASPLSCNVTVSDFWKWRKLDRHQRQLALNCQCLTEDHVLTSTADKDCPMNATEIFTAVRN